MSGIVEVHEKMLAQLQQRNIQLQQDKAEVELRLRQATALLSELQSVWMDVPPQLAASISKVLSTQNQRPSQPDSSPRFSQPGSSPRFPMSSPRFEGSTPRFEDSTPSNVRKDSYSAQDFPQDSTTTPQRAGWFSFNMTDMFGCTTPRGDVKQESVEVDGSTPPQPIKRSPPPQPEKRLSPLPTIVDKPSDSYRVDSDDEEESESARDSEPTPKAAATTVPVSPKFGVPDSPEFGTKAPIVPHLPICQMVHMEDNSPEQTYAEASVAENMVELLAEVPGATTLIAEIDVLCNALQKEAKRAHRLLEKRIETLKSEARQHRQRLEESYLRTTAAQQEDLELCKSKLAEITAELMPSMNMAGGLDLELCDSEWARCQRMSEQRARSGQAHADWLEEYFSQRISATETFRDAVKLNFEEDLEVVWQRKAVLMARFRNRLSSSFGDDGKLAVDPRELVGLRKELQSLERSAVTPLQKLADMSGRAEKEELARLKKAVSDANVQCKNTTCQLTDFLEESKLDVEGMRSSQNAEIFAHAHLRQRALMIVVLRGWVEHFLKWKLESKQKVFDEKDGEISVYEGKLHALENTHADVRNHLQHTMASRTSAVEFVQVHMSQNANLSIAFSVWVSVRLDSQLSSTREDLKSSHEEASSLKSKLNVTESAMAGSEKQLRRAQNFCDGDMLWLQNDKSKKLGVLVAVFGAWNLKRMETQLQGVMSELEGNRAECVESTRRLEPLQSAVHFAQRRASRRATLALVYCTWATQYLQHLSRRALRRETDVKRRTDEKLEQLRETVLHLVDDFQAEGVSGMLTVTPMKRNTRRQSCPSQLTAGSSVGQSVASSITGESPCYSEEDP